MNLIIPKRFLLVSCLLFLVVLSSAQAAELRFISKSQPIATGSDFKIDLVLFPEGENVNAVQGRITYHPDLVELQEIRDGGSIINLWVERPENKSGGSVFFSGVIPGGFADEKGLLFSLVFRGIKDGRVVLDVEDTQVLLNDGEGTKTVVRHNPLSLVFSSEPTLGVEEIEKDTTAPEQFSPYVSQDPSLFKGKYFLVFLTTDKGTGIARYEVGEAVPGTEERFIPWKAADSPYLLEDQELSRDIYVRAVDRAGNFVVARVPARHPKERVPAASLVVIVLLLLIALVAVLRFATQWTASKKRRQGCDF